MYAGHDIDPEPVMIIASPSTLHTTRCDDATAETSAEMTTDQRHPLVFTQFCAIGSLKLRELPQLMASANAIDLTLNREANVNELHEPPWPDIENVKGRPFSCYYLGVCHLVSRFNTLVVVSRSSYNQLLLLDIQPTS